jgi:Fe-S oxidoreductase
MYHDSRPAYLIAEGKPTHLAILPGYLEDEAQFGEGEVYEAPREILKSMGAEIVFGSWTRGLAKSCGADDGLWLTHPYLAQGLARQRLEYAESLGADQIITDSPLCAHWMAEFSSGDDPSVRWLPEALV